MPTLPGRITPEGVWLPGLLPWTYSTPSQSPPTREFFNTSGSWIKLAIGAGSGTDLGPVSVGYFFKRSNDDTRLMSVMSANDQDGAGNWKWAAGVFSNKLFSINFTDGTIIEGAAVGSADGWVLAVYTKPAGTSAGRWHSLKQGGSWVHANGAGGTQGDGPALDSDDHFQIGANQSSSNPTNNFEGNIAACGLIHGTELNDAAVEAAGLERGIQSWADVFTTAAWGLNQPTTATDVLDIAGHGADETSVGGDTLVDQVDGPPDFNWTLDTSFDVEIPYLISQYGGYY